MFFKNNTRVLITTAEIASIADLLNLNEPNTCLISALVDISVSVSTTTRIFSDGYNTINDDANRGIVSEYGNSSVYNIGLRTHVYADAVNGVGNIKLWQGLLNINSATIAPPDVFVLNTANIGQQLKEYSIIVINGTNCKIYSKSIVNALTTQFSLTELLTANWSILAGRCIDVDGVTLTGNTLSFPGGSCNVCVDSSPEYIASKTVTTKLGGTEWDQNTTGLDLSIPGSVSTGAAVTTMLLSDDLTIDQTALPGSSTIFVFGEYAGGGPAERYVTTTSKVLLKDLVELPVYVLKGSGPDGWGDIPEVGEDLVFSYSLDNINWVTLTSVTPASMPGNSWQYLKIPLPSNTNTIRGVYLKVSMPVTVAVNSAFDNWAVHIPSIYLSSYIEPTNIAITSGTFGISNNAAIIVGTAIDDYGTAYGHKLGGQKIAGSLSLYLRNGPTQEKLRSIVYNSESGIKNTEQTLSLSFKAGTRTFIIHVGKVFIDVPDTAYSSILTTNIQFTAANHEYNTLEICAK